MEKNSRHRPHCRGAGSSGRSVPNGLIGDWAVVSCPMMGSSILSPEAGTLGLSVSHPDRTPQWSFDRTAGSHGQPVAGPLRSVVRLVARSAGACSQSPKRGQGGWRLPAGRQLGQELRRRLLHEEDRSFNGLFRAGRGRLDPADLADVLAGGRLDLLWRGLGLQPTKGCDVATHDHEATGTGPVAATGGQRLVA
jgi:hypothetical protein